MSLYHYIARLPPSCDGILSSVMCHCLSFSYSHAPGVNLNMMVSLEVYKNTVEASIHNWTKLTIHKQL